MAHCALPVRLIVSFALCAFGLSVDAQDVLTVGGAQCSVGIAGGIVHVPIAIRDVSGTPLNIDNSVGSRIQAFSFRVIPTVPTAIATDGGGDLLVSVVPSGITSSLGVPVFTSTPRTPTSFGYVVTYDEGTQPLAFTLDGASPGNVVADVSVTLSSSATPGATIGLAVDPSAVVTALSNEAGTLAETVGNNLSVTNGCIVVASTAAVPTASDFMLLALGLILAGAALYALR